MRTCLSLWPRIQLGQYKVWRQELRGVLLQQGKIGELHLWLLHMCLFVYAPRLRCL